MHDQTVERVTWASFVIALAAIVAGVCLGILGVWGVIAGGEVLWRLLASDGIIFAGAVLANLAVACYRKPGGAAA